MSKYAYNLLSAVAAAGRPSKASCRSWSDANRVRTRPSAATPPDRRQTGRKNKRLNEPGDAVVQISPHAPHAPSEPISDESSIATRRHPNATAPSALHLLGSRTVLQSPRAHRPHVGRRKIRILADLSGFPALRLSRPRGAFAYQARVPIQTAHVQSQRSNLRQKNSDDALIDRSGSFFEPHRKMMS